MRAAVEGGRIEQSVAEIGEQHQIVVVEIRPRMRRTPDSAELLRLEQRIAGALVDESGFHQGRVGEWRHRDVLRHFAGTQTVGEAVDALDGSRPDAARQCLVRHLPNATGSESRDAATSFCEMFSTDTSTHSSFSFAEEADAETARARQQLGTSSSVKPPLDMSRNITKKRAVSMREDFRARQVASLEIVDYVAIVDEPSAAAAIEALRPDVYVKGPEYSNLLLDKTSNISHEKTLIESYGGRIHFTSGETFSSTKLSHFLLSSTEARRTIPCSATIA